MTVGETDGVHENADALGWRRKGKFDMVFQFEHLEPRG